MTDRGIWVFSDSGKTRETTPEKHVVHFHELLLKYFRVLKDYYKLFVNLSNNPFVKVRPEFRVTLFIFGY